MMELLSHTAFGITVPAFNYCLTSGMTYQYLYTPAPAKGVLVWLAFPAGTSLAISRRID